MTTSEMPAQASTVRQPVFSIVIPNFNYGRFIGAAVQSALDLDWPEVEVIVVDDGSTDNSLEVLASFGDRITVLRQENSGPRVACNRGYAVSHGDFVLFLDSDDQVDPSLAREVVAVWRRGVSKVQVQMRRVDDSGRATGTLFPDFDKVPTPYQVRYWIEETGAYPTPPGSGNVYYREFLKRLFPLDDSCGDATDSACLAAAPYLGNVVTIGKPLVSYRTHENNRSRLRDTERFTKQIQRAVQRQKFSLLVSGRTPDDEHAIQTLRRGRHLLQLRIAEKRLTEFTRPSVSGDSVGRLLQDAILSVRVPGPEPLERRLAIAIWSIVTLFAPMPLARDLIQNRFDPQQGSARIFEG